MGIGTLIAVNGNLYEYGGIEQAEYTKYLKMHKVYVVDIDEEGILTSTGITSYLTDDELSNRGINLTQQQWIGLTEQIIRNNYDLTEEEIETASEDIVYREFAILGVPTVEELPKIIETYMNR